MNKNLILLLFKKNEKKKFTSLLDKRDLCVTFVHPLITAKAAAKAFTGSFVLRTWIAPDLNFSINSSLTLSIDLICSNK